MNYALIQSLAALTAIAAAGTAVVRERARWRKRLDRLSRAGREALSGEGPIEAVRQEARGPLKPLSELVADLLHEVRRREWQNAVLDAEMSQRVANRTDALERSLATMRSQAERDPLTGLYNRRALDQAFQRVLDQCRSAGAGLYVLMIDLDRFKQVNDSLGHQAGDGLIADVGKLIRSSIRERDFGFRYGGDEFVVLLPGGTAGAAKALAERLENLGGELGRTLKVRPAPGLTVGMASLAEHPAAGVTELIAAADEALYAKKSLRKSA